MTKYLSAELLAPSLPEYHVTDISDVWGDEQMREVISRTNLRVPYLCEERELRKHGSIRISTEPIGIVLGASASDHGLDEPSRLFFALGTPDEIIAVRGTLEGRQAYGHPFVGYIETAPVLRRQGLAAKILPVLNEVSKVVYAEPLTAGPDDYLSADGRNLQAALAKQYNLNTNLTGFVQGK